MSRARDRDRLGRHNRSTSLDGGLLAVDTDIQGFRDGGGSPIPFVPPQVTPGLNPSEEEYPWSPQTTGMLQRALDMNGEDLDDNQPPGGGRIDGEDLDDDQPPAGGRIDEEDLEDDQPPAGDGVNGEGAAQPPAGGRVDGDDVLGAYQAPAGGRVDGEVLGAHSDGRQFIPDEVAADMVAIELAKQKVVQDRIAAEEASKKAENDRRAAEEASTKAENDRRAAEEASKEAKNDLDKAQKSAREAKELASKADDDKQLAERLAVEAANALDEATNAARAATEAAAQAVTSASQAGNRAAAANAAQEAAYWAGVRATVKSLIVSIFVGNNKEVDGKEVVKGLLAFVVFFFGVCTFIWGVIPIPEDASCFGPTDPDGGLAPYVVAFGVFLMASCINWFVGDGIMPCVLGLLGVWCFIWSGTHLQGWLSPYLGVLGMFLVVGGLTHAWFFTSLQFVQGLKDYLWGWLETYGKSLPSWLATFLSWGFSAIYWVCICLPALSALFVFFYLLDYFVPWLWLFPWCFNWAWDMGSGFWDGASESSVGGLVRFLWEHLSHLFLFGIICVLFGIIIYLVFNQIRTEPKPKAPSNQGSEVGGAGSQQAATPVGTTTPVPPTGGATPSPTYAAPSPVYDPNQTGNSHGQRGIFSG